MDENIKAVKNKPSKLWYLIPIFLIIAVGFIAYTYTSGVATTPKMSAIELVDTYCSGGTVSITIRNMGTNDITGDSITVTRTGSGSCTTEPSFGGTIKAGETSTSVGGTGCATGMIHTWRMAGQTNTISASVFCA